MSGSLVGCLCVHEIQVDGWLAYFAAVVVSDDTEAIHWNNRSRCSKYVAIRHPPVMYSMLPLARCAMSGPRIATISLVRAAKYQVECMFVRRSASMLRMVPASVAGVQ